MFFGSAFLTFMAIGGFPSFVEDMKVFYHERLSGHYSVTAFVVANTLASIPFLFLIAVSAGTLVYFMSKLHPGFGHYAYFILMLFAVLTCVESIMMAVSSIVGRNFLAGITIGAGIQVHALPQPILSQPTRNTSRKCLSGMALNVHHFTLDMFCINSSS